MPGERRYKLAPLDAPTERRILFDLRENDTLAEIARRYHQPLETIENIARANGRPKQKARPKPKAV